MNRTCLHCGETNIPHVMYEQKESINWWLLILAFIIFFPIGILLLICSGSSKLVPHYVCGSCGTKFGPTHEQIREAANRRSLIDKIILSCGLGMAVVMIVFVTVNALQNSKPTVEQVQEQLQQQRISEYK